MHPIATLGAGALILETNQVLLVQPNYGPAKNHWILPGGFINSGESPENCALRELLEETGQIGSVIAPLCVRYRYHPPDVYTVFRVKRTRETPLRKQDDELVDVRFWTVDEALSSEVVRPLTKFLLSFAQYGNTNALSLPTDYRENNQFYFF